MQLELQEEAEAIDPVSLVSAVNLEEARYLLQHFISLSITKVCFKPSNQRRLRQACTSTQSCQSLCYSLTQYREVEEASDKEPEIWPHWIAAYACLKEHKPQDTKVSFLVSWLIWLFDKVTINRHEN